MRQAVERANAIKPRLNGTDRAVLDAVFVLTAAKSRAEARSYNTVLARIANVDPKEVGLRLRKLRDHGVIEYEPSTTHNRARYALPPVVVADAHETPSGGLARQSEREYDGTL